jgi:hypothetical protein
MEDSNGKTLTEVQTERLIKHLKEKITDLEETNKKLKSRAAFYTDKSQKLMKIVTEREKELVRADHDRVILEAKYNTAIHCIGLLSSFIDQTRLNEDVPIINGRKD